MNLKKKPNIFNEKINLILHQDIVQHFHKFHQQYFFEDMFVVEIKFLLHGELWVIDDNN
jgi:hypothetical protein